VPAGQTVIIKSVSQHASRGMDSASIVPASAAMEEITRRQQRFGGSFFAEAFVPGREFNLSVLETPQGPRVLPIPEIRFDSLPPGRPHIVDWEAKWDDDAPAYYQTEREFGLEKREPVLAAQLRDLALDCWNGFGMNGYARVDFRVDKAGMPYILEINANPCLAPDAGFAMAGAQAGLAYAQLLQAIVNAATGSCGKQTRTASNPTPRPAATSSAFDDSVQWRSMVTLDDPLKVRQLVMDTHMFTEDEAAVAEELVIERIERGAASGYEFILAEHNGQLLGYACYGQTPLTEHSFDLYWIVVNRACQGRGLGRLLLDRVEKATVAAGGRSLWVDTSSTRHYQPTRAFYQKTGFEQSAELRNFYRAGDNKVIFVKHLQA